MNPAHILQLLFSLRIKLAKEGSKLQLQKKKKNMAKDYSKLCKHLFLIIYHLLKTILLCWIPLKWNPTKDVSGQIVLITGAGNGLGRMLALRFAKLKCRVVIWDVDDRGNEETCRLVKEIDGDIYSYHVDVTDRDMVYKTAAKVKSEVGKVDILVNNAGIVIGKPLFQLEDKDIQSVYEVNALANFWTAKAFVPDMMSENHGHVVNMSSISGVFGVDLFIDYSSTKHALNGFDESLKLEFIRRGLDNVHTTLICPFLIKGGFFDGFYDGVVDVLDPDYSMDEIMAAILTNTEVIYLPKSFAIFALFRPLISRPMLYNIQNFAADRSLANTVTVRPFGKFSNVKNGSI